MSTSGIVRFPRPTLRRFWGEPVHLYECSLHRKWKIRRAQGKTNSFQSQKQLQGRDKCKKRKPGNLNNAERCKEGPKVKRKKQLGNSSGDNAEWWRKVRRGNQKWSRGHRPVYLHLPRAIQAADKLQQMKKMLVFPVFSFSFNKFCRSRSLPYQPISSSQLPTVVWERWQGWSETCATSETSRARWRRHQRRHQQQDRQHSFTMELSQPGWLGTLGINCWWLVASKIADSNRGYCGVIIEVLRFFSWI